MRQNVQNQGLLREAQEETCQEKKITKKCVDWTKTDHKWKRDEERAITDNRSDRDEERIRTADRSTRD